MAKRYPLRNLYCICCGVFLAAIVFTTWIDYRGTVLSGLDTGVGPAMLALGISTVGLGLHPGFDQAKGALVALAGLAASGLVGTFGEQIGWTGTTYWLAIGIALGLVIAVIGASGLLVPEPVEVNLDQADVQ